MFRYLHINAHLEWHEDSWRGTSREFFFSSEELYPVMLQQMMKTSVSWGATKALRPSWALSSCQWSWRRCTRCRSACRVPRTPVTHTHPHKESIWRAALAAGGTRMQPPRGRRYRTPDPVFALCPSIAVYKTHTLVHWSSQRQGQVDFLVNSLIGWKTCFLTLTCAL